MKTTVHVPDEGHINGMRVPLIRRPTLCKMLGISRSTSYLKSNPRSTYFDSRFPKAVRIGLKSVGWKMGEVMAYIDSLDRV